MAVTRSIQEKLEFRKNLELRTRSFAVLVFKYIDALPKTNSAKVIAYQLGKSASSVGANYREANRSESSADFAHKVSIALKECIESLYWLEILSELRPHSDTCCKLRAECDELVRIFQTAMSKLRKKRQA